MTLTIQRYHFHCRFDTEARLPGYLGSTLRGALGWALKRTCCTLRHQQCPTCILNRNCSYAWLFETEVYQDGPGSVNARPHPFVLQPGEQELENAKPGDPLDFSLLLMGRAVEMLPHLLFAVRQMGTVGIGSGRRQGLGRFSLDTVREGERIIYDEKEQVLHRPTAALPLKLDQTAAMPVREITVTLQSPLRLKQDNRMQHQDLPFGTLVRAALRRIASLETAYSGKEPDLDYRELAQQAGHITTAANQIRWQQLYRWSNRQNKKVSLSGLGGSIRYQGDLTAFLPLLHYCEQVNLGKQTVFGLGRISIAPK